MARSTKKESKACTRKRSSSHDFLWWPWGTTSSCHCSIIYSRFRPSDLARAARSQARLRWSWLSLRQPSASQIHAPSPLQGSIRSLFNATLATAHVSGLVLIRRTSPSLWAASWNKEISCKTAASQYHDFCSLAVSSASPLRRHPGPAFFRSALHTKHIFQNWPYNNRFTTDSAVR